MAAILATVAAAQEAADLESVVRTAAQRPIDNRQCLGIAVGVITEAGRQVFGIGEARAWEGRPPDGRTVFEIGSISKTLAAILLAQAILAGDVSLETPIQACLPDGVRVPTFEGRAITLLDLATHRSGLPRDAPNLWDLHHLGSLDAIFNPFVAYTPDRLYAFLNAYHLKRAPGAKFVYSNLGAGLLGFALSLRAQEEYERLVVDRVCDPLGMSDTRIVLSAEQRARVSPGYMQIVPKPYLPGRFPSSYKPAPVLGGAGSFRSTADDMLTYLAANLGLIETPLAKAIAMTHAPQRENSPRQSIGLFWHIETKDGLDEPVILHTGLTGGYESFIGFLKSRRVGVVVLSNGMTSMTPVGMAILRHLAGVPAGQSEQRVPQ